MNLSVCLLRVNLSYDCCNIGFSVQLSIAVCVCVSVCRSVTCRSELLNDDCDIIDYSVQLSIVVCLSVCLLHVDLNC